MSSQVLLKKKLRKRHRHSPMKIAVNSESELREIYSFSVTVFWAILVLVLTFMDICVAMLSQRRLVAFMNTCWRVVISSLPSSRLGTQFRWSYLSARRIFHMTD